MPFSIAANCINALGSFGMVGVAGDCAPAKVAINIQPNAINARAFR
jgi:hypothetical protein